MTRAILISVIRQLREKRDMETDGRRAWVLQRIIGELVKEVDRDGR